MPRAATKKASTKKVEAKDKIRSAYSAATTDLRKAHRDEFDSYMKKHAARLGVDWHPRLTPEQKAERDFDRLIEEYPHLADRAYALLDAGEDPEATQDATPRGSRPVEDVHLPDEESA